MELFERIIQVSGENVTQVIFHATLEFIYTHFKYPWFRQLLRFVEFANNKIISRNVEIKIWLDQI